MTIAAIDKLRAAQTRTGSLLSIGLEPCAEYQPSSVPATIDGYRGYLRTVVRATRGECCAYKFNVAFFESLGSKGIDLLHEIRADLPDDALVIADAKRGDIGTTAKHYARAIFDDLGADSVTLSPLMGRDSAEPFLSYTDRLSFFLCLTSNPGAADFLMKNGLYRDVASTVASWDAASNCGLVVGATKPAFVAEIRGLAPRLPFLVPGLGAQGGEIEAVVRNGRVSADFSGVVLHVTRGVLATGDFRGDIEEAIRTKTRAWNDQIRAAAARV